MFWDLVSRPPRLFLASLAYPRVEKVLARNGLDPALAAELAPGRRIHVLDAGNPWHRRAAALFPRSIGRRESCDEVMERLLGRTHILEGKRDFIVMKPKDHQAYTLQNLNPDESYGHTLLHEIVHCSKANKALPHPAHKEGHADCRPIDALALRAEDPERLRARFHRSVAAHRPKGGDAVHDTILYIDAVSHGLPPPDGETLEQAAPSPKC